MSIIQSIREPEYSLAQETPSLVAYDAAHETQSHAMSVVLLHNVKDKDISLREVVEAYISIGMHKVYVLLSDGTAPSEPLSHMRNVCVLTYKKEHADTADLTFGELINSAMHSVDIDTVFISWTNINPCKISLLSFVNDMHDNPLCIVPSIEDRYGRVISSTFFPKKHISGIMPYRMHDNHLYPFTLFPFDGIGIYDRKKFLKVGGINTSIKDSYWQLFEFGLRSYMNDMIIRLSPYNRVRAMNDMHNIPKSNAVLYHMLCVKFSLGLKLFHLMRCAFSFSYSVLRDMYDMRSSCTYSRIQKKKISQKIKEYWPQY